MLRTYYSNFPGLLDHKFTQFSIIEERITTNCRIHNLHNSQCFKVTFAIKKEIRSSASSSHHGTSTVQSAGLVGRKRCSFDPMPSSWALTMYWMTSIKAKESTNPTVFGTLKNCPLEQFFDGEGVPQREDWKCTKLQNYQHDEHKLLGAGGGGGCWVGKKHQHVHYFARRKVQMKTQEKFPVNLSIFHFISLKP